MSSNGLKPRPAPPPRSARRCPHGEMEMRWVDDARFHSGGYWKLECEDCEVEAVALFGSDAVLADTPDFGEPDE